MDPVLNQLDPLLMLQPILRLKPFRLEKVNISFLFEFTFFNCRIHFILGTVDVTILDPNGAAEKADVRFNNDKNLTYSVSYIPKTEGGHKIFVKFSGRDIPKSPYDVKVEGHAGDASKVTASGPGLQSDGLSIGRTTYFDIHTKGNFNC